MSAFEVELWSWYGLAVLVVAARLTSRVMLHGSVLKLQIDDWLMLIVMASYTVLSASVHILNYTPTNLVEPGSDLNFSDEEFETRVFGSKMVLVVEQMQMILIWLVKACFLIMYSRLTASLKQRVAVKITAGYIAVSFVVMQILWFGVWCRPFWHYWQVPPDSIQCSIEKNHLITNAAFNISSDLVIIAIPMPIFFKAQLPPKRKAILIGVFALGGFTVLSAILNKYYSFSQPYGTDWVFWYIREAATAIIVANLPFTWTLLQRMFHLRTFNGKSSNNTPGLTSRSRSRYRSAYGTLGSRTRGNDLGTGVEKKNITVHNHDFDGSESQEQINGDYDIPLEIYRQDEVHVSSEAASDESVLPSPGEEGSRTTVMAKAVLKK